jgi:transposase
LSRPGRLSIMSAMAKSLVDRLVPDELWALVEPLLPPAPRRGRRRVVPDRNCFAALVFMCRTSTPWALLPTGELGCGSATTAWRRLEEWQHAGVFDCLSLVLMDQLGEAGRIDHGRVSVDSASLRALKGGRTPAQTPSIAASAAASCTWPATTAPACPLWCC